MCAFYPPPKYNLPIYNPSNYQINTTNLDYATAEQIFYKRSGGVISGLATANVGINSTGQVNITNTTNSTSRVTGALVVSGGLGVDLDTHMSNLHLNASTSELKVSGVNGFLNINNNTTASTSSTTGALRCAGGGYFGNNSRFDGNVNLQGTSKLLALYDNIIRFRADSDVNHQIVYDNTGGLDGLEVRGNGGVRLTTTASSGIIEINRQANLTGNVRVGSSGRIFRQIDIQEITLTSVNITGGNFITSAITWNFTFTNSPQIFGCVSEMTSGSNFHRALISFYQRTTTGCTMVIQNTHDSGNTISGNLTISVLAIGL
jgi:hypothetical protein